MKFIFASLIFVSAFSAFGATEQVFGPVVRVQRNFTVDMDKLFANCTINDNGVMSCPVEEFTDKSPMPSNVVAKEVYTGDDMWLGLTSNGYVLRMICDNVTAAQCIAHHRPALQHDIAGKTYSIVADVVR